MLKLPLWALFSRTIPEGILAIYAVYVFCNKKFEWKKILWFGSAFGIILYLIRLLPISFGVHTIIGLLVYFALTIRFVEVNTISAVISCIVYVIILSLSENITVSLLLYLTGSTLENVLDNPVKTLLYSFPSLILVFAIIWCYHHVKLHQKRKSSGMAK